MSACFLGHQFTRCTRPDYIILGNKYAIPPRRKCHVTIIIIDYKSRNSIEIQFLSSGKAMVSVQDDTSMLVNDYWCCPVTRVPDGFNQTSTMLEIMIFVWLKTRYVYKAGLNLFYSYVERYHNSLPLCYLRLLFPPLMGKSK